ncbi:MAG: nuclear transport factor 2 family protein [Phycisphaerales bacterium]|nr:nuclear transport factor 2 family protein [Phycisphaerales bacterium]MCB9835251.1 nuclear transport factor 2 family protein [Phycisphaera sp.]
MKSILLALLFTLPFCSYAEPKDEVNDLLNRMHEATKAADDGAYFAMFTDDAVFFGTDVWERWELPEFESLYRPYMQSGRGWWFQMRDRHISVQPGGEVAIFDETLYSAAYGQCRGTGACRLEDGAWKIASYHLDITIPNSVSTPIVQMIRDEEGNRIELMTFNIRYGTADDGDNVWNNRRDLVTGLIRGELPDVLGVQEALRFQIDEMSEAMPGYAWVGVGRDDGEQAGEFAPILYNTDKLRLLQSGTFWFSETPDVPGSKSYGNSIPRICTWAYFTPYQASNPRPFMVANVHLDHQSDESRLKSMQQVRKLLDEDDLGESYPCFVIGDFNCAPDSAPIATLIGQGWLEALDDDAKTGTFHGFTGEAGDKRIDMILMPDRCELEESEVITLGGENGVWPSDHYPVRAIVTLYPQRDD